MGYIAKRPRKAVLIKKLICFVVSCVLFLYAVTPDTFAWSSLRQHRTGPAILSSDTGVATLTKYEKDVDGNETSAPVKGATFHLFRKNGDGEDTQIGGRLITDEDGRIVVTGLGDGLYYFIEIDPAFGYERDDGDEESAKYYFVLDADNGRDIIVNVYNKRISASLMITKTVVNAGGGELTAAQRALPFEFTVVFSDGGEYGYKIGNAEHTVASGGTLCLKHNEAAVFERMPVGVSYTVTETPLPGYIITSDNHQGTITTDGSMAAFTNIYAPDIGALSIQKIVRNADASPLTPEQESLMFTYIVTFSDGGTYDYFLNGEARALASGGTLTLRHDDTAVFLDIPAGVGYTVTETGLPAGYIPLVTGRSGVISGSQVAALIFTNVYDETPDEKQGALAIRKLVSGSTADRDKLFEFTVTFEANGSAAVPDNLEYRIGEEVFVFTNGGKITLKHGETALFLDLPALLKYTVTEKDYSAEGYTATVSRAGGYIAAGVYAIAEFINAKPDEPDTVLTVKKQVDDDSVNPGREFEFSLYYNGVLQQTFRLAANGQKTFYIPYGVVYDVEETISDDYSLVSVTRGHGTAHGGTVEVVVSNLFTGIEMTELSGEKIWDTKDDPAAIIPDSITVLLKQGDDVVETAVVTPDENGDWYFNFTAPKYDADGELIEYTIEEVPVDGYICGIDGDFTITNTYVTMVRYEPLAHKTVTGDTVTLPAVFSFLLTAVNNAPMPDGSEDAKKTVTVTGSGTKGFGGIEFTKAGTYVYLITESADNLPSYTYDAAIYTLVVTVEQQDDELVVVSAVYTKTGDSTGYDAAAFTNIYTKPEAGTVSVLKTWVGDDPNRPTSVQAQLYKDGWAYGDPVTLNEANGWAYTWADLDTKAVWTVDEPSVPAHYTAQVIGSADDGFIITNTFDGGVYEQVTISGAKTWKHGTNPMPSRPASITVYLKNQDGIVLRQEIGEADGWKWSFTVDRYAEDGTEHIYTIDEDPIPEYTKQISGFNIVNVHDTYEEVTVSGTKTWEHGDNDTKRPSSITVYVKNGNAVAAQKTVTAADGWAYSFLLPKYNVAGLEITYTIDEANVPYYTAEKHGYSLTNTFKGFGYSGDTPPTGDADNDVMTWLGAMIITGTMMVAIPVASGKKRYRFKRRKKFSQYPKRHRYPR